VSAVRLRWQKIVNQLKFLYQELRLCKEMGDLGGPEFQQYYEKFCAKHNIDLAELNGTHQARLDELYGRQEKILPDEPEGESTALTPYDEDISDPDAYAEMIAQAETIQTDIGIHEAFSILFRKLALKLHPDSQPLDATPKQKLENMERFKEAKTALDERRYYVLIELAGEFDIEPPKNYQEQINWMHNEIGAVGQLIAKAKGSYNYLFVECENDEQRDILVSQFLKHLFNLDI
jgi:hypothetical protein